MTGRETRGKSQMPLLPRGDGQSVQGIKRENCEGGGAMRLAEKKKSAQKM